MIIIFMAFQKNNRCFFVDTSAFVAMVYEKDPSYDHYQEMLTELGKNPLSIFITTDDILDETFTMLRSRAHLSVLEIESFWGKILTAGVRIEFLTKEDFSRGFSLMKKYHDHLLSFTDALTASFMHHHGIKSILTADHDFQMFGFEIL